MIAIVKNAKNSDPKYSKKYHGSLCSIEAKQIFASNPRGRVTCAGCFEKKNV